MKIGYARVSTDDQKMDLQRDALTAAGCEKVFNDTDSGAKAERIPLHTSFFSFENNGLEKNFVRASGYQTASAPAKST